MRKCPCCEQVMRSDYQPRQRRNDAGQWVDVGGWYMHTCDNTECALGGYTLTDDVLNDPVQLQKYCAAA